MSSKSSSILSENSPSLFTFKKKIRQSFGKIPNIAEIPNLMQVQRKSYENFLQIDEASDTRKNKGLESVFKVIFPISNNENSATLEYVSYRLGYPKYDVAECIQRGVNYAVALIVTLRLIIWEDDLETKTKEIKSIKEQEVYMGEIPLMTENGTFVINGAQRVIVSQMHRSPGAFYFHDGGKNSMAGKYLYSARIIPYRGSWLDFEFDARDLLFFRIDRKRKLYASTLLRALGYEQDEILKDFYNFKTYYQRDNKWIVEFNPENFLGTKPTYDIIDADTDKVLLKAGVRVTLKIAKEMQSSNKVYFNVNLQDLVGTYIATTIKDKNDQEIIQSGFELTEDILEYLASTLKLKEIQVLDIDNVRVGPYMRNTLIADKNITKEDALFEIYKILRPGEPATIESAENTFNNTFFNPDRYDLSAVGRMKINIRHNIDIPEENTFLRKEDIVAFIKNLVMVKDGHFDIDDIDSLKNRRVRSVGELIENQFRLGLVRIERSVVERMNNVEIDNVMPHDLVNYKSLMSIINEFFGTSQLSQFMDQTNPLSEVTHKRRLSSLGQGGLTRDRASFEARDVHPTHYGRICPIETPEGQNIGLINSLATYAKINQYGFIESLYRKVIEGKVTEEIIYLSAIEESRYTIAQANVKLDKDNQFVEDLINCRRDGEFVLAHNTEINYIDVSPKQLVSVAASLIPFLENDDANRALMGSNMQRQAVPLIRNEAPIIGTGMEAVIARDSSAVVIAKRSGVVEHVDGNRIVVKVHDKIRYEDTKEDMEALGVDIYNLVKYNKSNQGSCINQKPIVKVGDHIKKGDIIADGAATDLGELALGKNVFVAFLAWNGYTFEDSIIISERLVQKDDFTSIHIEEFEAIARDTRLGPEEITRDIPNVSEENMRHLDESGIVYIGAEVKPGDILIGKVTPKTESPLTPEEKLLRAIFGEKASEVRDSSLRVPPGIRGTVISVRMFTRRGVPKNERAISLERIEIEKLTQDKDDRLNIVKNFVFNALEEVLIDKIVGVDSTFEKKGGKKSNKKDNNTQDDKHTQGLKIGEKITKTALNKLDHYLWWGISIDNKEITRKIMHLKCFLDKTIEDLDIELKRNIEKIQSGEDLPQGAMKVVKVYIATKLKLQPGDKMAGRHGNKGVVSKIAAIEDMPFMEDGTPIDVILNPLGLPSRMNVGQILETHLGWAAVNIGKQIGELLDQVQKDREKIDFLKEKLLDVFDIEGRSEEKNCKYIPDLIEKMTPAELLELSYNLREGVPLATPVFDGAKEVDIDKWLKKAGVNKSGQIPLIDGRTGEYFDRQITVGIMYMMKLDHLVNNKIHARSIGPYSLVTQQPLGGKSHFGGQRFGEMECWALQAYGAAYTLQEMLTVKSDDIAGRVQMYDSIIKSNLTFNCGTPESFNVMVKELRSLCLNVDLCQNDEAQIQENIDNIRDSIYYEKDDTDDKIDEGRNKDNISDDNYKKTAIANDVESQNNNDNKDNKIIKKKMIN